MQIHMQICHEWCAQPAGHGNLITFSSRCKLCLRMAFDGILWSFVPCVIDIACRLLSEFARRRRRNYLECYAFRRFSGGFWWLRLESVYDDAYYVLGLECGGLTHSAFLGKGVVVTADLLFEWILVVLLHPGCGV